MTTSRSKWRPLNSSSKLRNPAIPTPSAHRKLQRWEVRKISTRVPGAKYRTMYAAIAIEGAFAETILHGKTDEQIVSRAYVDQRAWTELVTVRPLKLLKLYDEGLF